MIIKEADLLNLIRTGDDKEAILFLYKSVYPLVKRYIKQRKGTQDDAYDVFQESLLEVYQSIMTDTFQEKFTVTGYLYRVCTFKWLNKSKRDNKIAYQHELPDILIEEMKEHQELVFVNSEDENILKQYFAEIGDKCVELLTNTIILDFSLEEAKRQMAFNSIGAVKMQHKRCKQKMMELLAKYPKILDKLRDKVNG